MKMWEIMYLMVHSGTDYNTQTKLKSYYNYRSNYAGVYN